MKKLLSKFSQFSSSAGFTLIELLVVIGILGILASALVATIDPFEQLKKANDTNVKNVAVEFLNANVRYYTTHNAMPWDTAAAGGNAACNTQFTSALQTSGTLLSTLPTCIAALTAEKELKAGFADVTNVLNKITVSYTAASIQTKVCFQPTAVSGQKDKATKYSTLTGTVNPAADNTPAACQGYGGAATCFWCTE